jgi:type IV pilus assembly protein PilA
MKPQTVASGASAPISARPDVSGQPAGSDAMVVAAMRTIVTAEITYASSYPAMGFTCSLSSLDGFGGGEPNEHQAMLINSGLASGKKYGYVFSLLGCAGAPAAKFHLTAAPNGNSYGRKAFCADQSGVVRSSSDGSAASCLASGVPVQ